MNLKSGFKRKKIELREKKFILKVNFIKNNKKKLMKI
jgi:hypothetical protein